jgi:hypothetical protein
MEINLSHHWHKIQTFLFPRLEEELGPMTSKHHQLITTIELARVEDVINTRYHRIGRPLGNRKNIAHAYIAKAIYNLPTTASIIERLHSDSKMRQICGWSSKYDIPSESTFSRAFAEFSETSLATRIHESFIKTHHSTSRFHHVLRDSTPIEAREKSIKKPEKTKKPPQKKRGRPKKDTIAPIDKEQTRLELQVTMRLDEMLADLPKACDVGCKKNSKGFIASWKGYKLHIDTADGDLPISAILTSASVHDSQVALPLSQITEQRISHYYDLMDAAYDSKIIRDYSVSKGRVALIDFNHRGPKDTRSFEKHEAERYKARSGAERVNSQLKDNFGGSLIRVKGHAKIMCHLMFGLLALTIDQSLRLLT